MAFPPQIIGPAAEIPPPDDVTNAYIAKYLEIRDDDIPGHDGL